MSPKASDTGPPGPIYEISTTPASGARSSREGDKNHNTVSNKADRSAAAKSGGGLNKGDFKTKGRRRKG